MSTPEGLVKQKIKEYLIEIGAYFFMPVQYGYGAKAIDFLCCLNGDFIGIEAKAPGKEATPLQKHCMKQINDAGGYAFCVDNIEDCRKIIDAYLAR
jgi:hypothetical protein